MLLQQLVPVVEQELMEVVETDPGRCSKIVDIDGLPGCRCFLCAGSTLRHAPGQYLLTGVIGKNPASGHGLSLH
jgi:hypothetical protein